MLGEYVQSQYEETGGQVHQPRRYHPRGVLRTQSDETSLLFRDYFGMDYHICLCWECEALQSAVDECGDGEVDFEKLANKVVNDLAAHRLLELKRRKQV